MPEPGVSRDVLALLALGMLLSAGCRNDRPHDDVLVEPTMSATAPYALYKDGIECYQGFRPVRGLDRDALILWHWGGGNLATGMVHTRRGRLPRLPAWAIWDFQSPLLLSPSGRLMFGSFSHQLMPEAAPFKMHRLLDTPSAPRMQAIPQRFIMDLASLEIVATHNPPPPPEGWSKGGFHSACWGPDDRMLYVARAYHRVGARGGKPETEMEVLDRFDVPTCTVTELHRFPGIKLLSLLLSPNRRYVLAAACQAGYDREDRSHYPLLIDMETWTTRTFPHDGYADWVMSWSSDSCRFVYVDERGAVLADVGTGATRRLEGRGDQIVSDPTNVAFRPGSSLVAMDTRNLGVVLYDVDTDEVTPIVSTPSRMRGCSLDWSRDGQLLYGTLRHTKFYKLKQGPDLFQGVFGGDPRGDVVEQGEYYPFCADMVRKEIAFYDSWLTQDRHVYGFVIEDPSAVATILGAMKERRESALLRLASPDPAIRFSALDDLEWTYDNVALEKAVQIYFQDPCPEVRVHAIVYHGQVLQRYYIDWTKKYEDSKGFPLLPVDIVTMLESGKGARGEQGEDLHALVKAVRSDMEQAIRKYRQDHGGPVSLDP